MPAVARIGIDKIVTGHLCSTIAGIKGPGAQGANGKVIIAGGIAAVETDAIAPHTIRSGRACVPHDAVINKGSTKIIAAGKPLARIGDSADAGRIISGSFSVFAGG
jgi:uncharacterized Zn-binding protein involved in type VI secretion